jgi:hypothetical protein
MYTTPWIAITWWLLRIWPSLQTETFKFSDDICQKWRTLDAAYVQSIAGFKSNSGKNLESPLENFTNTVFRFSMDSFYTEPAQFSTVSE